MRGSKTGLPEKLEHINEVEKSTIFKILESKKESGLGYMIIEELQAALPLMKGVQ